MYAEPKIGGVRNISRVLADPIHPFIPVVNVKQKAAERDRVVYFQIRGESPLPFGFPVGFSRNVDRFAVSENTHVHVVL